MTIEELRKYFGSSYKMHKDTGISHTQWIRWMRKGYIPIRSQIRIEEKTEGQLRARIEDL